MLNRKSWWSVPLLLAGLALVVFAFGASTSKPAESAFAAHPDLSNTILVKFKTGASEQAIEALNANEATQQVDAIPALGIRVLRVPPGKGAGKAAFAYANNPLVEFAEANSLVTPEAVPNDPYFANEWHLAKIQAATAWDSAKATGVTATVCDTGVSATQPDLISVLRADLGWNAADGTANWAPIIGHGTAVAGTIAAAANNGIGVAGVAWGAQIIPVRISNLADGSAYVSDAAKCINYGADHGSRVINVSYRMASSSALDAAGKYAQSKGALTFVAAGNDGVEQVWTNYPGFIAVSATGSTDAMASFSNWGAYVDLAAPGQNIKTTWVDGTYQVASGTSFSSPVAAGVAALVFGANPGLSASQAQAVLFASGDDLGTAGWDPYYGNGRVNATKAVAAAGGTPAPTPTATPTTAPIAPTATPTSTVSAPSPTPTTTSTPAPTATPAPTKQLVTNTFKGKLNAKTTSTASHSVTVTADGPLEIRLSWTGKGAAGMTVTGSGGTLTSQSPASLIVPAGVYTVTVRAMSGNISYQLSATHY